MSAKPIRRHHIIAVVRNNSINNCHRSQPDQHSCTLYTIRVCVSAIQLTRVHVAMWPTLHYSVDLRIQTYTEPVPLKYGKLTTNFRGYTEFIFYGVRATGVFSVSRPDLVLRYDRN